MPMRRPGVITKNGSRSIYVPGKSGGDPRGPIGPYGNSSPPFALNINPANFTRLRAGYLAFKAGTRNLNLSIMGNSTDRGVDETASPYNSQYPLSLAEQLAILFRAEGLPAGANNWYGISGTSLADYTNRDSRLVTGGTTAMGSSVIQGGASLSMSSATAVAAFTPQGPWRVAEIFSVQNAAFNGATLAANIDGGANTNIVQDTSNTIRKTVLTAASVGIHTVNLAWVSGANALFGINCYDDTRKEITIHQWAQSGGTASQMIDNTGSPSAGRINQMNLYQPDCVFGDLGLVNSWRNGIAVNTVKTQCESLIDAVRAANADFIFCTPPFDSGSAGNTANQQQYIDAVIASCIAKGCAVFDIRKLWQSKANSDLLGFTSGSDFVHPRIAGQASRAKAIKPLLRYGMGLSI